MNLITSAEHRFAKAAQDVVGAAKFITATVLPILKKTNADAATVEAVTALVDPGAVNVERAAFAVLGAVIKAIEDGQSAAASAGLNISLDAALIADVKAITPSVKNAVTVAAGVTPAA